MDNYNYPLGADTKDAPWNQEDIPEKEIEVCVSITLSKTVKVRVSDYTVESGTDEEGEHFEDIDYYSCDLKKAVEEQITLPQDAWKHITNKSNKGVQVFYDLKDWDVDNMEIIPE